MDQKLIEVAQTFERFKAAFTRNDFDTCTRLLSNLEVSLTEFRSLPQLFEATPNAAQELTLARDIYEHVVLSAKMEDQEAFERDFCQLKTYYTYSSRFQCCGELLSSNALENACIQCFGECLH